METVVARMQCNDVELQSRCQLISLRSSSMPLSSRGPLADQYLSIAATAVVSDIGFIGTTSRGKIAFFEVDASMKHQYHAHSAPIWDVSVGHCHDGVCDFVTGEQNGHGVWWSRDPAAPDTLLCRDVVRLPNDVYAVRHTSSGRAVGFGGYLPHVLIRGAPAEGPGGEAPRSAEVLMSTAVQALAAVAESDLLRCGGSDGSVTAIDAVAESIVWSVPRHGKKCPCVATNGAHTVASGSYEGTVKVWDVRAAADSKCEVIKFREAVTGLAADGSYMAACVGEGLHVWDLRNLSVTLGSAPKAWKGPSRGIVVDSSHNSIVTASSDGMARFWSYETWDSESPLLPK